MTGGAAFFVLVFSVLSVLCSSKAAAAAKEFKKDEAKAD